MRFVYAKADNTVGLELRDKAGSEDWGEMGEHCRCTRNENSHKGLLCSTHGK